LHNSQKESTKRKTTAFVGNDLSKPSTLPATRDPSAANVKGLKSKEEGEIESTFLKECLLFEKHLSILETSLFYHLYFNSYQVKSFSFS
jgi:hypothetical protein